MLYSYSKSIVMLLLHFSLFIYEYYTSLYSYANTTITIERNVVNSKLLEILKSSPPFHFSTWVWR